jgi:uncharacterized protein (TIGR03437 family)
VAVDTSVSVTGSYNGVTLTAGPVVLKTSVKSVAGLSCAPSSIPSGGSTTCTVSLSGAVSASTPISLAAQTGIQVPASVAVPAGASTAAFQAVAATVTSNTTARVTASLNGTYGFSDVSITAPENTPALSVISCTGGSLIAPGATATCTATLSRAATSTVSVGLSSDNTGIEVPASVSIPAGAPSATFTARATPAAAGYSTISAQAGGVKKSTILLIVPGAKLSSLACRNTNVAAGGSTECTATLSQTAPAGGMQLALSSSSPSVSVASSVQVPAGSISVAFPVQAAKIGSAVLTASANGVTVSATVNTVTLKPTSVSCTPNPATAGALVVCRVDLNAVAPAAVTLSATSGAPGAISVPLAVAVDAGAAYGRIIGMSSASAVAQNVVLKAAMNGAEVSTNVAIATAAAKPAATVSSAAAAGPFIQSVRNAASLSTESACSSGAAALITGSGFYDDAVVTANEQPVRVLLASASALIVECPQAQPGAALQFRVRTAEGTSRAATVVAADVAPGVFTQSGNGTGDAVAELGDGTMTIFCTGVGASVTPGSTQPAVMPVVLVDGFSAEVVSFRAEAPGTYSVQVRVPQAVAPVRNRLEVRLPSADGHEVRANVTTIDLEPRIP